MHSAELKLRLERQQKMGILFLFCSSILHQFCPFVPLQRKAMEKEKKRLAEMCHARIAPLFVHARNCDGCRGSAVMWLLQKLFWFLACCTTSRTRWWTCVRSISTAIVKCHVAFEVEVSCTFGFVQGLKVSPFGQDQKWCIWIHWMMTQRPNCRSRFGGWVTSSFPFQAESPKMLGDSVRVTL